MSNKATTAFLFMSLSLLLVVTLEAFLFEQKTLSSMNDTPPILTPQQQLQLSDKNHPLLTIFEMSFKHPAQALEQLETWQSQQKQAPNTIEQVFTLWIRRVAAKNDRNTIEKIDRELRSIAQVNQLGWLEAKLNIEQAYRDIKQGTYAQGIETVAIAIDYAESIRADFLLLEAYNTAGILYNANNQLKQSQKYFQKGVELGEKYPNSEFNARFSNNLGLLYVHSEQWQRAIEYLKQAENIYATSKYAEPESLLIILMNQSYVYNQLNQVDLSRSAYEKALQYVRSDTPDYYRIVQIKSLARLQLLEGSAQEASETAMTCINSNAIDRYPKQKGICQLEYALAMVDRGEIQNAHDAIVESIGTFVAIEHQRWLIKSHLVLAEILEKKGQHEQALKVYKKYHDQERVQILAEIHLLETAFEVEELERERDLLDVQNELKELEKGLSDQRLRVLYVWFGAIVAFAIWLVMRWKKEKKRSQYLHDLSYKDPLTRVGNRRLYHSELKKPTLLDSGALYRVTLIDLDWFKAVNDNYGHEVGDAVLTETASRLKSKLNNKELIVRWGGEEFLLLLETNSDYQVRAQSLVDLINNKPYRINGLELNVSISLGASNASTVASLKDNQDEFQVADQCLYQAKAQGRNQVVIPEEL
ncbi:diguanylate cyclase [Vibrio sp. TBV020]|uniref:tetratricopeptide repeat-containing diguanylate cyclase n=1 Tax=Vibrio sp. TBV020 TaxID=3137398 RepID=UPI0038CD64A1